MGELGKRDEVDLLVTGVGCVPTVYRLTQALAEGSYDLIVNVGVAGGFGRDLPVGTVVQVGSDCFADLGAEDGDAFLDVFRLGLADPDEAPFREGRLQNNFQVTGLPVVRGITVNTAHGNQERIERTRSLFPAEVESMEGAGFFYVCMNRGQRCLQVRGISNFVERRCRENWDIPLAVKNLNAALPGVLDECLRKPF